MSSIDINKWTALEILDKDFVENIDFAYTSGYHQIFIVTKDDNVYSYGLNGCGCLGVGHQNLVLQPTLVEELCQKRVINVEFGLNSDFTLALTENGTVFYCGCLAYQQQSNRLLRKFKNKPEIFNNLTNKRIIDIKAGLYHSLALTQSGEVFLWGFPGGEEPSKVILRTNQKIISISSGRVHCLALTESGDVYLGEKMIIRSGCSFNWIQLDTYMTLNRDLRHLNVPITKICCGPRHSLLLAKNGNVYCFGNNQFGQCGDATNDDRDLPTTMRVSINAKFIDIAATKHYSISVGLTDNGSCYIWGECGEQNLNKPFAIPSNNMYELIEYYSSEQITYKPLHFNSGDSTTIMDRIGEKFDNSDYSDIAFKVEDENIYAQKSHLINVCKHFETMFSGNNWAESNRNEIEINEYSYSVYYAFIKYLYTDSIEVNDEESIELLDLANCYLEEKLKQRCVEIIKKSVKIENVFDIYYASVKTNSKELQDCCIEYIQNNFADKTKIKSILENAITLIEK